MPDIPAESQGQPCRCDLITGDHDTRDHASEAAAVPDDPDREWYCEKCGSVVDKSARFCPQCGDRFEDGTAGDADPPILVRTYKGRQQADAVEGFEAEAADLALDGYSPVSQSWAQGQWGGRAFLFALLLCIVFVGQGSSQQAFEEMPMSRLRSARFRDRPSRPTRA